MKDKIKNILDNGGVIVFDTNVYLNIYDRSPEYSNFSLKVIESIMDKVWMPCTVKREFGRNHRACFGRQRKKVENACAKLKQHIDAASDKIAHQCKVIKTFEFPDIDSIQARINEHLDSAKSIIQDYSEEHAILEMINDANMQEDAVAAYVADIVNGGRLLSEFTAEELYALAQEGDKRYIGKTPPGFKDDGKQSGLDKYGDYFIWEQTMRWAKENNLAVIFVTDDTKNDWYQQNGDELVFHDALVKEFADRVGTEFVGTNSRTFFDVISDIKHIDKPNALICALEFTTEKYIQELVDEEIIYDCVEYLTFSYEDFVDMETLTASATEGLDISEDILEAEYVDYEIGEIVDDEIIYYLIYRIKTTATSYEYWGRDDDTKDVVRSDGRIHKLAGEVVVEVKRKIDEDLILDGSSAYSDVRLISGDLKEYEAYDKEELCVQCGRKPGDFQNYNGEPICEDCMKVDVEGEICTYCGRKIPSEFMYSDNCCEKCAKLYNK